MRILILHNRYQFSGGEEQSVVSDAELLAAHGHETRQYSRAYEEIARRGPLARTGVAVDLMWSRTSYREVREAIRRWRPDVAHFHNIVPLISPSAYWACHAEGVPVVQTLHNYRLVCPKGTLLREGKPCELCVGHLPWPAVRYACYRGSHLQSLAMASSIGGHAALGTWQHQVDAFVALTTFARDMFIRGGLPADRIFIRTNAVAGIEPVAYPGPGSAIYVGRLSPEKGISTLLAAWELVPDVPLTIVGGGPLLPEVRSAAARPELRHVDVAGELPHAEVLERLGRAGMLIFPSLWYEGLPYTVLEALATGRPVVTSDIGAQAEIIAEGVNGLHFATGDPEGLAAAVRRLHASPGLADQLARGARRVFDERYAPERSYAQLMDVYAYVRRER